MKNILLPFLLLLLTAPLTGQPSDNDKVTEYLDYERPRDFTIADIEVTGVKFLQTAYLVNISGLAIGQEITIPGEDITNAIEKFWALGLFADVRIIARKIEGKSIYLEIQLTEQPRLNKLYIHGLKKSDTKDVDEKIKLKPGGQITENVLNNTTTIIKKHFVDKGFFKCDVRMVQKADTAMNNKVFLDIFLCDEHPYGILAVELVD
jgi:outer membrane protein insertion porin family